MLVWTYDARSKRHVIHRHGHHHDPDVGSKIFRGMPSFENTASCFLFSAIRIAMLIIAEIIEIKDGELNHALNNFVDCSA